MTKLLNTVSMALTIVGALNWGLIGGFDFNLVTTLLGTGTMFTTITYIVVGIAGAYTGYTHFVGKSE